MNITICTDVRKAKEQLATLEEFKGRLPSEGMYFRYSDAIAIDEDFVSERFQQREVVFRESWERRRVSVLAAFDEIASHEQGADDPVEVRCYLVTLGPYGYYDAPNEVFVNIWDAPIEHALETMAHEALHIIFLNKTTGMTHEERERFIDGQFKRPSMARAFPCYK